MDLNNSENNAVVHLVSNQQQQDEDIIQQQQLKSNKNLVQSVLSYNLFLRPPLIKNNQDDMKNERTKLFIEALEAFDIACLQEVFAFLNSRKHKLIYNSMKLGFYHHAQSSDPTFLDGTLVDGGLLTLSKHPIVYSKFKAYQYGVLSDNIALKGILYTKIQVNNDSGERHHLHLFNTHLQASYVGVESNVKASVVTRINQLRTLRKFVVEMLEENKFSKDLNDLCLIVGDYNVNALSKGHPVRFLQDGQHDDIINGLNLKNQTIFKEYDVLKAILSNYGQDYLQDTLKSSHNGESPITYGDSQRNEDGEIIFDENNKEIPRETVLTCPEDFHSKQCLDYIMVYQPGSKQQSQTQQGNLQYIENSTKVEPFFTNSYYPKQDITVTQMSDHYGVSCDIAYAQNK